MLKKALSPERVTCSDVEICRTVNTYASSIQFILRQLFKDEFGRLSHERIGISNLHELQ